MLIAIATAEPSPAAVMTCARGLVALPAAHTPGTLVRPSAVDADESVLAQVAAERGGEAVGVGAHRGADEERVAGDDGAVGELHAAESVVVDDEALDDAFDDLDPARVRHRCGVREQDHVVAPLTQQLRVLDGADHADRLVAHLPAVAVRAVQEVAAPALADAFDVGERVRGAGGEQDVGGLDGPAARESQREAGARRPATRSSTSSTP